MVFTKCFKFICIIPIVLKNFLLYACRQTQPFKNHENFDANELIEDPLQL
ncbi:MAG: hypothetical protein ACJA1A_003919 [Saprospiraceae bacterium]|jgi:hypothetical protein